ncbi:MAG TPA: NEW3 domain-containing protein [Candidatus Limnocylindrales bacterium]|nr:NEW3 domain-containing protein [Candidatus Limnocylindrales bacterium]
MSTSTTRRPERARAAARRIAIVTATTALMFGALVPTVAADDGLEVTTAYPAVAVAPGSKVSFDLKVTSTREANVGLSLSGVPAGWTATLHGGGFVIDGVSAGPGADGTARLDVTVPADATASTSSIQVRASGGGASDTLEISVRVDAAAAGDITITTDKPSLTGSSNDTFPFALTLHNDTAQDVTVSATASVTDHEDWDVTAEIAGSEQAASTVVEAGSTTSINVTADPPDDAPAGQYAVHVEVTAGDQKIPGDFAVDLTGSYSMTLTTPGGLLSAHGGAGSATQQQFILTNTGTATIQAVKVSATPPTGWTVTWDQDTVDVPVDAPVTVTATITPSGEAVAGDYVITFNANADQADSSAQVRFTVETSPLWALVGIGIIAVILIGLFYVFRTYGRR